MGERRGLLNSGGNLRHWAHNEIYPVDSINELKPFHL